MAPILNTIKAIQKNQFQLKRHPFCGHSQCNHCLYEHWPTIRFSIGIDFKSRRPSGLHLEILFQCIIGIRRHRLRINQTTRYKNKHQRK